MKKAVVWILAAAIILGLLTPLSRMEAQASSANLLVSVSGPGSVTIPSEQASATAMFTITVTNLTAQPITGVQVSGTGGSATAGTLQAAGSPGDSSTVSLSVPVSGGGGSRTASETFQISYFHDGTPGVASGWASFNVNVTPTPTPEPPPPAPVSPNIHLMAPQLVTLAPGEAREVQLTFRNNGLGTASEILTAVSTGAGAPFTVEIINNLRIATMPANSERTITLRITVDDDAEPGTTNHEIRLAHTFRTTTVASTTINNTLHVRIGGEAAVPPAIQIANFRGLDTPVAPGESFTVWADVVNTGGGTARNVQVTLPSLPAHIILTSNLNDALVPALEAGHWQTLAFTFQASSAAPAGTSGLLFRANFTDDAGRARDAAEATRFVNVVPAEDETARLQIRNVVAPAGTFAAGQRANFSLEVYNAGDVTLTNISVTAVPPAGINPMSQVTVVVPSLAAGAVETVSFAFSPGTSAGNHTHTVRFNADFRANGEAEQVSQFAAMNVYISDDDEEDELQRPWIVIDDFFTDPPLIVRAGQDFTLTMTFRNTSDLHPLHNARIVFTPVGVGQHGDIVFIPVGGSSNTVFIDHIPPGESQTIQMSFFTVGDAAPRSYTVRVEFEYQAPGFERPFTDEVNIAIRVSQFIRLETNPSNIWIPDTVTLGQNIMLDFRPVNTGRVTIHNLRIRLEAEGHTPETPIFDTSELEEYIGDLSNARWVTYRGQFSPLVPGFHEGYIVLYGEDPAFDPVELRIPFSMYVIDPFGGGGDGWEDPWHPGDPWDPHDPWFPPHDPWDPGAGEPAEAPGFWRRVWNWLTTPLGGYAGVRRNQTNGGGQQFDPFAPPMNMPREDIFWGLESEFYDGQNAAEGFVPLRAITETITVIPGGGGVMVSPGGGRAVLRPMPAPAPGRPIGGGIGDEPIVGVDEFGNPIFGEAEADGFFIYVWNFVRMPIFLFPFAAIASVGTVRIVKRVKRRRAEDEDEDLDDE